MMYRDAEVDDENMRVDTESAGNANGMGITVTSHRLAEAQRLGRGIFPMAIMRWFIEGLGIELRDLCVVSPPLP
jgi:hypothetical protein